MVNAKASWRDEDKEVFYNARDRIVHLQLGKAGKIESLFKEVLDESRVCIGGEMRFKFSPLLRALSIGMSMEHTDALLQVVNAEIRESKKVLETLANEVHALADVIQPELIRHITSLRESRMGLVNEVRECLNSMREIRKFFIESDYKLEMERLQRFVDLCKEVQALKASGVFDAVCDSVIRLAIKEPIQEPKDAKLQQG